MSAFITNIILFDKQKNIILLKNGIYFHTHLYIHFLMSHIIQKNLKMKEQVIIIIIMIQIKFGSIMIE